MQVLNCCLTAYCHSQLPSRHRRYLHSSIPYSGPYELVYRTCGEALAFLVGWLLVLHHFSATTLIVRSVGTHADALLSTTHDQTSFRIVPLSNHSNATSGDTGFSSTYGAAGTGAAPANGVTDVATVQSVESWWPSPAALTVSVLMSVVTMTTATGDLFGEIGHRLGDRARFCMSSSMMSSWSTGCAVAIDVLALGLLTFAAAVSVFHGLHFGNWTGIERFFHGEVSGVSTY
jgi:hypothetical protein